MKAHPVLGEKICEPLRQDRLILQVVRHHHERYDGSGYPDGLSGDDIPLAARIMAVVDAYYALTTDRAYRVRLSREEALRTLKDGANRQFDPRVAVGFASPLEAGRLGQKL